MRDPSFVNLQALPRDGAGPLHRRHDRLPGDAGSDPRRDGPMSESDHLHAVRDAGAIARPPRGPGWDEARRPRAADPAAIPELATVDVPAELRADDRASTWRCIPTATRRCCPALEAAQTRARLVLGRGDPAGGRGDAGHARLLSSRSRASTTCSSTERPSARATCTCARTSPASCATRSRVLDALAEATGAQGLADGRRDPARVRVPRRLRHGADGVDRRPLRGPLDARATRAEIVARA